MFPYADYFPSKATQLTEVPLIPLAGCGDLVSPLVGQLVLPQGKAPAVPEIAIDENHKPSPAKDNIRAAGKVLHVRCEVHLVASKFGKDGSLWASILALDPGH